MDMDEPIVTHNNKEEEDLIEFEELDDEEESEDSSGAQEHLQHQDAERASDDQGASQEAPSEEEEGDDDIEWGDDDDEEEKQKAPMKKIPVRKPKSMGGGGDSEREAKMKKDRLESAKRYESLRLYEDAIKYYTMAGRLDEAERVRGIMEGLYLDKAREFERSGRMDEAAHLFDILKMREDAARCRSQSSVPKAAGLEDEAPSSGAIAAFTSMNNPDIHITDPETSPYIAAGQEHAQEVPIRKPKEKQKAFTFCPYCGEEFDLPKSPKYCPYCREPLS